MNLDKCSVAFALAVLCILVRSGKSLNLEEELKVTLDQKLAIDKLRSRVIPFVTEPYMKEDLHLLRWLRAADFNVEKAQRMVLENIKWRKENKVANIHLEDFSDMHEEYPYIFTQDIQGQPTFIGYAGDWDLRAAVVTGRAPRVIRHVVRAMENAARMIREMQHTGKNITRLNLILVMDGVSVAQHTCPQCLLRTLDFLFIYLNQYPGVADRVLAVDTPPTMAFAANLIRSSSDAELNKAFKVYGKDKRVWKKALLQFIDKDKLPVELGGTRDRSSFGREPDLSL